MSLTPRELHATSAEVAEFVLTLTALCIVLLIIAKLYPKLFNKILHIDSQKVIKYAEPTSVLGALVGVAVFLFSIYTGIPRVRGGAEAMVKSPLIMNMVMTSVFGLELWVIFLVVRAVHGKKVWNNRGLSMVYAVIGLAGFLFTIETGSLGHHLAGRGSILDPFYELLNINPERFYAMGTLGIYALIGICILAGILRAKWKMKPVVAVVNPEKCINTKVNCGICAERCPYGAIETPEKQPAKVITAMCNGCGICVDECPSDAIAQRHFIDEQIFDQIRTSLERDLESKIPARIHV